MTIKAITTKTNHLILAYIKEQFQNIKTKYNHCNGLFELSDYLITLQKITFLP